MTRSDLPLIQSPFMPAPPPRSIGSALRAPVQAATIELGGAPLGPALAASFLGVLDDFTIIPPDTMGAVGPSHLMVMLNSEVLVQDKTGQRLEPPISLPSFWTASGKLVGMPFDPDLLYDPGAGRWIATVAADADSPTSQVWVAISDGADPTEEWKFYGFPADETGDTWADFPRVGLNNTWIAISANMFGVGGENPFAGAKMWVVDRETALAGGALTVTVFPTHFDLVNNVDGFVIEPAVTFGDEPTLYLVDYSGLSSVGVQLVRLSQITGTGPAPEWSVVPNGEFQAGLFFVENNFNAEQINASQLGVAPTCDGGTRDGDGCSRDIDCPPGPPDAVCRLIDTNDSRMLNAVFRNGRLWCTHSGGLPARSAPNRTAVFWYQLDPQTMPHPIVQSGVIDGGAGIHHFFPSIAVNTDDDACIGFSRSDVTRHPEGVYTGRSFLDPSGTVAPVAVLKAGEAVYLKSGISEKSIRWGDFSATVIDPSDDRTCWTLQEYAALDERLDPTGRWGTWWGKLEYPQATPSATPATATPTSTATRPTVTPTPTRPPCVGDCNRDGRVSVADLVIAVQIALGNLPLDACSAIDSNADGQVSIAELVAAVAASVAGCPT